MLERERDSRAQKEHYNFFQTCPENNLIKLALILSVHYYVFISTPLPSVINLNCMSPMSNIS